MVQSRQETGSEDARLHNFSRRAVIAGTAATTLSADKIAAAVASTDQTAKLYGSWLRIDAKIERLQTRWAKLESWLVKKRRWFHLSEMEQQASPWARELDDIDGLLLTLYRQQEALTERLPMAGAASLQAVITKLLVVERLVCQEDHPEANQMIEGALKDLMVLTTARRGEPTNLPLKR